MGQMFGSESGSGQCESGNLVGAGALAPETACDDRRDILPAFHAIRHRRTIERSRKFKAPMLLAGLLVVGAQSFVIGGTDENQAAARGDGSPDIWPARIG